MRKTTYKELHDNLNAIKEEGLYPIVEFFLKISIKIVRRLKV